MLQSFSMRPLSLFGLMTVFMCHAGVAGDAAIIRASENFDPGFIWQEHSIVSGDFDCSGRKPSAILGTNKTEIASLVFLNGTRKPPEILHYSARARNPSTAKLTVEDLDYDPVSIIGQELPGFARSKTCQGLNLSDGEVDSAHIYWSHAARRFLTWGL